MSTGFNFDVFNNTSRDINFSTTGNTFLQGANVTFPVVAGSWMSAHNNNAPFALVLLSDTGSLSFQVQDVSSNNEATFTLEFDGTSLVNFQGMAFYGSAGDIANAVKISETDGVGYIFPLLYMNQLFDGNPLAVLMLVEAIDASPDVNTPYGVS
jgi:hypothetical protein